MPTSRGFRDVGRDAPDFGGGGPKAAGVVAARFWVTQRFTVAIRPSKVIILSVVAASHREAATESKDPY